MSKSSHPGCGGPALCLPDVPRPRQRLWLPPSQELKVLSVRRELPGGVTLVASASVPESVGPPLTPKKTRARLLTGGGVIVPVSDGCVVTFLTQIDFGGMLPGAIVVRAGLRAPATRPVVLLSPTDGCG